MPGIQVFTRFNVGKETVRGTPVAPTRQMYAEGTGVIDDDRKLTFHETENRGRRSSIVRATQQSEDPSLRFATSEGVSWDELVVPFSQIQGGRSGAGGGADKTWSFLPSMTAANNPESYSVDAGDDVQNWRFQYVMARSFELSAGRDDITQLSMDCFAQRAVKTAAASPAGNVAPKISGALWQVKFAGTFAGLGGAAVQTNLMLSWKLHVDTGLIFRSYQDGNFYGAQHVETRIGGTLELRVESTATSVSEFYDKYTAITQDYVRLQALGPALGASNYNVRMDMPVLMDKPSIIDEEDDGVNIWSVPMKLNDDLTNPPFQVSTLVNSLAALP